MRKGNTMNAGHAGLCVLVLILLTSCATEPVQEINPKDAELTALRQQVEQLRAQTEMERGNAEKIKGLQSQVFALEERLRGMQDIVMAKDEELARLEAELEKLKKPIGPGKGKPNSLPKNKTTP